MAKRAISTVSEDSSDESRAASPKRARTDDSEEADAPQASTRGAKGKGKAPRPADDVDDDNDDDDDGVVDEDEEKKFEEEHEELIRDALMNKAKTQGGIAEMGIIESLEMHQFMCHKFLTFNLGPQINFIIGHNGSGKSAVLSALTVALGGKATTTGRGSGLKSFIREGQTQAEVSVTLKNQGEEAYKPKEYGKSITIMRRFRNDGSSFYKIKSKDGKVISTKREELSAICDHMNIQVDNPMNILTQDAARQFLSASAPAEKYKFFLKGTQLSQLSDEYQTCMENISQTQKVLARKADAIPVLEERLEDVKARFNEAKKARQQKHKVDELTKELAWAHVYAKEAELRSVVENAAKLARRVPKVQEAQKIAEAKVQEATKKVEQLEAELVGLGTITGLRDRKEEINRKLRDIKRKLADYKNEEKAIDSNVKLLDKQIAEFEEKIAVERKRSQDFSQTKRDDIERQLEKAKADLTDAEKHIRDLQEQREKLRTEAESTQTEGTKLQQTLDAVRQEILNYEDQLRRCTEREGNRLAPFGNSMERVLADIDRVQWYGSKPLGPIGLYVKVKQPEKWANLMRVQIGNHMTSFIIGDARDRPQLDAILKKYNNKSINIIVGQRDDFDWSEGEPPARYETVLRALDISDMHVCRVLINSLRIEAILLAPSRADADRLLRELGTPGVAWSGDHYKVTRFGPNGGKSEPLQQLDRNHGDWRHQLFSGDDIAAAKRTWQDRLHEATERQRPLQAQINALKARYSEIRRSMATIDSDSKRARDNYNALREVRDNLQVEANEDMPAGISGLQSAKEEVENDRQLQISQFKAVAANKAAIDEAQEPLRQELDDVNSSIDLFQEKHNAISKQIEDAVAERLTAQHEMTHYAKKLEEEQKKVEDAESDVKKVQQEFELWTVKAEEIGPRVQTSRKPEDITRIRESVKAALREREKKQGASVEDMTIELNNAQNALDTANKDLQNMIALNKALKKSVKLRLAKWHEFRRHIALRCKVYFSYHLSNRGYYGKVLFDHVRGTLMLKVQTDDQIATQNTREKDPRSLSGGEKSFSTICLLLSLWESIGCPIRCLDEFDVFMDAVNRRISMKMMIDTANASDRKQYVLITPQDMTNIHIGNTVRVHRMSDPERGQGVLTF